MEKDQIIKKYIKVFVLVQIKNINYIANKIEFEFDETKTAICLGTIFDNIPITLASNTIYPKFTYSKQTELNTYYLLDVLDYGTPIKVDDKLMVLQDSEEELRQKYQITKDWYYDELLEQEKQNIKSFQKEKAKILGK